MEAPALAAGRTPRPEMVKQSSDEQELRTRARRRLIGAAVLAVVAAGILPLVLDREPPPVSRELEVKLPASDGGFSSRIVPVTRPDSAGAAGAKATGEPAGRPPTAGRAEAPPSAKPDKPAAKPDRPVQKAGDKPQAKPAAPKEAIAGESYVVQLAALSNEDNVRQLREKLSGAGIKSYTEKLKLSAGEATRVRVGPFSSREAALRMQERLKGLGVAGAVVPE